MKVSPFLCLSFSPRSVFFALRCGARAVPSAVPSAVFWAWPGHRGCGSQRRGGGGRRSKWGARLPAPPVGAGGRPRPSPRRSSPALGTGGGGAGSPRSLLTGRRRVAQSRCQACARLPWRWSQNVPDVQVIRVREPSGHAVEQCLLGWK